MQVVWQKNAILNEYRCIHCIQVYGIVNRTSRSVKNKAANVGKRRAEHSRRRPSPFFVQDEDELFVTGSTLYAGDGGQTPLRTQPPWFSAAVGHRKTEPGGYFCRKLTLTRTPDPIRPTRRGPDPNRPTNGRKQGGACPGSFGQTPPETIGDSRTEFTL